MVLPSYLTSKVWSFLLVLTIVYQQADCETDKKEKLSDVQVLTLFRDQFTTGRRLPAVAQLKCINGFYICEQYAPSAVQCYNKGQDGNDVQWECKADLDRRVKFGYLKVTCEGYDSPRDKYILVGSCGLEYSLELTYRSAKNYNDNFHRDLYEASKLSNFLTFLIIIVVILIVYKSCTKYHDHDHNRPDFSNVFSHGGGAETANLHCPSGVHASTFPPPPPPYAYADPSSTAQPHPPGFKPEYVPNSSSQERPTSSSANPNTSSNSNGWGNFLTGVGVGGVTGFLISRRNTSPTREIESTRRSGTDSPPPAYHDHYNATGFATTSRR